MGASVSKINYFLIEHYEIRLAEPHEKKVFGDDSELYRIHTGRNW